ncbi:hypothetical protein AYJ56_09720 [Brucella anthropi]|nr:hypothetical protein AYJ56_09720 [Brucella anthropi]
MTTLIAFQFGLAGIERTENRASDNELCSGFPYIVIGIQHEIVLIHRCFENIRLTVFELYNIIIGVNNTPLS